MLTQTFQSILSISLTLSVVILLLAGLYLLISRRYAAKWRMFLWAALALRLILPFNLSFENAPIQVNIPTRQEIVVETPSSPPATQTTPPIANPESVFEIQQPTGNYTVLDQVSPLPQTVPTVKTVIVDKMTILAILWLCGLLLALSVRLIKYYRFRRYVKRYGRAISQDAILSRLRVMKAALSIHTNITPLLLPELKSPTVTGCIKPVLLLPTTDYTETEWDAILSHELTHFKRGDLWLKLLLWVAELIHWFNPLVYLVSHLANRDMELACDAAVVNNTSLDNKKCYSHAILSALEKTYFNPCRRPLLSTGFDGGKKSLKGRFASIFDDSKKKKGIFALIAVIVVIAIVGACFAFQTGGIKQTNETLTIWLDDPRYANDYKDIIATFQSEHPDVTVTVAEMPDPVYEQWTGDEGYHQETLQQTLTFQNETLPAYYERLRNDLIAGKGADIILFNPEVFNDLYKTIAAGAFCDLSPFLKADPDYKPEDYQQAVLSAGMMNGKQYTMPLFYQLPCGIMAEENIDTSFDLSKQSSYYDVVGELAEYVQKGGTLPVHGGPQGKLKNADEEKDSPIGRINLTGAFAMDYEKQQITFDETRFRQLQEWNKIIYNSPKADGLYQWNSAQDLEEAGRGYFRLAWTSLFVHEKKQQRLFYPCEKMGSSLTLANSLQYTLKQTPVIAPLRDGKGKLQATAVYGAAIRNNSENQQNAYEFLKLLMGNGLQDSSYGDSYIPIAKGSVTAYLGRTKIRYSGTSRGTPSLSDSYYEQWKVWLNEIDSASFPTNLDDWMMEYFEPFYKGENSYEECLQKTKDQLEIYISE